LKGKKPSSWRKAHYYHYYEYPAVHSVKRHYGIITEQYKLVRYYHDIDEWELYDRVADPLELRNFYNEPEYESVKEELKDELNRLMEKYGDSYEQAKSLIPASKN
jgi:arylsulfatase A-like enzyme